MSTHSLIGLDEQPAPSIWQRVRSFLSTSGSAPYGSAWSGWSH